jgi:hypothetical protein
MEITSTDLLDSVRCSFEIAVSALVQAGVNLGTLGFEPTKLEVLAVVDDLRDAITAIDNHKSNAQVERTQKAKTEQTQAQPETRPSEVRSDALLGSCCFRCKHWTGKRRKQTAYCTRLHLSGKDAPHGTACCVLWEKRKNACMPNAKHEARAIAIRPECGCSASSIGGKDNG